MIVDIRERHDYSKGHIYGSVNIPEHHIKYQLEFLASLDSIELVCSTGLHAMRISALLEKHGIKSKYRKL